MKLAEALNLRADLQKRIEQLRFRLTQNAKVQEGELPAEQPKTLLAELDDCINQFQALIAAINITNSVVKDSDGKSLTELIAGRDALTLRLSVLRSFTNEAANLVFRNSKNEIKMLSTVNVGELRTEIDEKAKDLRELNTLIQSLNWTTDLIDYNYVIN